MRALLVLLIISSLLCFQNCGRFGGWTGDLAPQVQSTKLSDFYGKSGTYALDLASAGDVQTMSALGMTLHIGDAATQRTPLRTYGSKMILNVAYIFYNLCESGQNCTIDAAAETAALKNFQDILGNAKNDPDIVGFWILDDYHGLTDPSFLERMHDLVAQSNLANGLHRSTVCGFSGDSLDTDVATTTTPHNTAAFLDPLSNFSPNACDFVTYYVYAKTNVDSMTADRFDWSMTKLLPDIMQLLRSRGWDPTAQPLIGMPGAFGSSTATGWRYVVPSQQNIADQITAFCNAGAVAILPFIWRDDGDSFVTPSGNSEIRAGLNQGLLNCRTRYWAL